MSIYSDHKCGALTDEEFKPLARREEASYPNFPEEQTRFCEECEFCKPAKRFIQEIVTREADGAQVLRQTENYCWMDICVRDTEHIREIHRWDEICNDHGELCERVE